MAPWPTLMAAAVAASPPPSTEQAGPTAFVWWSDIILPLLVGLGSIAVAVVAILIAQRSNRLAREATRAAAQSNEIARRANRLEEQRDRRAADEDAKLEREAFRARWQIVLDRMAGELERGFGDSDVTARMGAQLITEGEVRDLYPPHAAALRLLQRAAEVEGGDILFSQAAAAANALMHDWARSPARVDFAVAKWDAWMATRVQEFADDRERGLPT